MENTALHEINGLQLLTRRKKVTDEDVVHKVIGEDCYDLSQLKASGYEPAVIFDVGAHIGTFSVLAHSLWPDAQIYAFEPTPRSFELLCENTPFARCYNVAVRYDGESRYEGGGRYDGRDRYDGANLYSEVGEHTVFDEHVKTMTLEEVFLENGIEQVDLAKFGCQGREIHSFKHMSPAMASKFKRLVGDYYSGEYPSGERHRGDTHTGLGFTEFQSLAEKTFPHLEFYDGNGSADSGGNGNSGDIGTFRSAPAVPGARRFKSSSQAMYVRPLSLRAYSQDNNLFPTVKNANVLLYFPHGFGDWVQFSYILPFLEPSNRYWIARFGDDNTALLENHPTVTPLYLGANSTHGGDGRNYGNEHFGLRYDELDGGERTLQLPLAAYEACLRQEINTFLWCRFPESWGEGAAPYHSKPRHQLPSLVSAERLSELSLEQPLPSSIDFSVEAWVSGWVERRLMSFTGWEAGRRKLCLICRNGYTSIGKNWGHMFREDMPEEKRREGEECRDFMRLLLRKDPRWVFLVIEDRLFEGDNTVRSLHHQCWSYAELFGTPDNTHIPFGLVMKSLVGKADLSIGVPAGPYHLSMARPELPTVGVWIEHLPSWYDEPRSNSFHVVSRNVRDRNLWERPGSFLTRGELHFPGHEVETRIITGEQVLAAVEHLLY